MTIDHTDRVLEPGATLVSLHFAKHPDVDLRNCKGANVNAIGADLPRSKFAGADLRGALLCHCDLTGADFTGADLTDANLHGSDCTGATWTGAKLDRVMWDDCKARPKEADEAEPWEAAPAEPSKELREP